MRQTRRYRRTVYTVHTLAAPGCRDSRDIFQLS